MHPKYLISKVYLFKKHLVIKEIDLFEIQSLGLIYNLTDKILLMLFNVCNQVIHLGLLDFFKFHYKYNIIMCRLVPTRKWPCK